MFPSALSNPVTLHDPSFSLKEQGHLIVIMGVAGWKLYNIKITMNQKILLLTVLLAGLFLFGCTPYPNLQIWIFTFPEIPEGPAPFWVYFRAQVGFSGGEIVLCEWAFGDGNRGIGSEVLHIYESPGVYTATLTVTHDSGVKASKSKTVTVDPPALQILEYRHRVESDGVYRQVVLVEGRAKNISSRRLSPASVFVRIFDADGNRVGKAHVRHFDYLDPGEVWPFRVHCDIVGPVDIARVEVIPGQCWYGN